MRLLKLPAARFDRVMYASPQSLVTAGVDPTGFVALLWDLANDAGPLHLSPQQAAWSSVRFKSGGAQFLSAQGVWTSDRLPSVVEPDARVWDLLKVEGRPEWEPFAFGPDGETVLFRQAGLIDGAYQTHFYLRAPDGAVHDLYQAWGMFTPSAVFSPNGRLAAMSNGLRVAAVWDTVEPRERLRLTQSDKTSALAFVSDEHLVAAAGRSVRLSDVTDGRSVAKFRAFRKFVDALAVSPDRKLFAAGSRDGLVRVWESASAREVKEYDWKVGEIRALAFSPDGTTAAAAGTSAVVVWDLD